MPEAVLEGRDAIRRRAWQEAYELLSGVEAELGADDLEALADAAFWSQRLDEALTLRERAHRAYLDEGDRLKAARLAVRLALDNVMKAAIPLARGWFAKGERLLAEEPESIEHGQAALTRGIFHEIEGKLDDQLRESERAFEIASRHGDTNLQALALAAQGSALVVMGELDRGLALLDEASTSALTGELDPFSATVVYCMTISGAQGVGDFERARQWTDAASRWCELDGTKGFPGACRVHRSEILWLGGYWEEAEREAVDACNELGSYNVYVTAAGYYQIGEIHRRRGDFAAADEAYRKSHELGRDPQPGQALLLLAQGKATEAAAALRRSLGDEERDAISRARRLPAQVEVSLAVGDLETARAAAAELEELTERFRVNGERTPLLEGGLRVALARIALATGDLDAAESCARSALAIWTKVGAPYEAAEARIALGMAYERKDDRDGARAEFEAAKAAYERLGAVLDAERVRELLGEAEAIRRTFLFTDIVGSTRLLLERGEQAWKQLLDRHDAVLGAAIRSHGGEVIKHTGDGFFAAFAMAREAIEAAVQAQQALADEEFAVRIGIHSGEALQRGNDYAGRGVNVAARVGALGGPGEILVSSESVDGSSPYPLADERTEELKGFAEPVPIAAVAWR